MFSGQPSPAPNPSDVIIPFNYFDDSILWKSFILYSLFVFDDVLDAQKLASSLTALAQRPGWRKLGARLRQNKSGSLEYHVPSEFTTERTALSFSHDEHSIPASEHPLASLLPNPTQSPSVVCNPDDFHGLMRPEGSPSKIGDYLNADIPQLGLHVVTFKDKTLVTLYWPHTLFDAMGKRALLDAWMLVLSGNEEEVELPFGADGEDPFTALGTRPTEPHKLESQRMSLFGLALYGIRNIIDFAFTPQFNQMVCVPAGFIEKLTEESIEGLAHESESQSQKPFISEGDVLCAWWTRTIISHMDPNSTQTVVLNNAYSMRSVLAADLIPKGRIYVSNAIGFINVILPVRDILQKPLSFLASQMRRSIDQYGTRAQVESFASLIRGSSARLPPFFGDSGMHMITFSNWCKANLFEVDFSAAVIEAGSEDENHRVGRPVYIQNCQLGLTLPNGFPIIGKDMDGNYWLSGYMNQQRWDHVKKVLATEGKAS